jgi:hypothetical protein
MTSINSNDGASLTPVEARQKFKTVSGIVAREGVSIHLPDWKKVSHTQLESIKEEILQYFIVPREYMARVERAALMTAGKAWKQWKTKLVSEFVQVEKSPLGRFAQITQDVWDEFVVLKTSDEFKKEKEFGCEYTRQEIREPTQNGDCWVCGHAIEMG